MARKRDKDTQDETSDGPIAVNDAWTGMLAVSLLALILGAALLGYDWYPYSDKPPDAPKFSSPSSVNKPGDGGAPKVDAPPPKVEGAKDGEAKKDA